MAEERDAATAGAGLSPRRETSRPRPDWAAGDREQVAVVSFSHAIQHCYPAVLGIAYPFALAEFHVSYALLGVILAVTGIIGGLMQSLAGVVKRFPARLLLGAQNLGIAGASVLGAIAPGFSIFAGARVLGQLVSWPQHPVGSAHLTDRVPHRRGLVLAAHTTGGNVGTLIAPIVGSAIIATIGWRWALVVMGALMAAGSLLTWTRVRPAPHRGTGQTEAARQAADPPRPGTPSVALRHALRRRAAVAVLVAGTVSAAGRGLGVLTTYIPAYLRDDLHKPALTIGIIATIVSVGAVGGPLFGGHLSDRVGRRAVLYTLYGCGAVGLASFVLVGSGVLSLALAGLVVGVFTYSEQPLRQALFSDAMRGVSARAAFGAYFAISQSIGAIWIAVIGFLVTDVGYHVAFFVMAASFVVAGTIIALFARDRAAPGMTIA